MASIQFNPFVKIRAGIEFLCLAPMEDPFIVIAGHSLSADRGPHAGFGAGHRHVAYVCPLWKRARFGGTQLQQAAARR
jgi:hypothetical protein